LSDIEKFPLDPVIVSEKFLTGSTRFRFGDNQRWLRMTPPRRGCWHRSQEAERL